MDDVEDEFDENADVHVDEDELPDEDDEGLRDHVMRRTIVVPEWKVLFLPTLKTACTSLLWQLAALAGIPQEHFADSALPGVSPAMTIHDMNLWNKRFRFGRLSREERHAILEDDGWFRFAVVRNPTTRVWSAWQSKLLLHEPRYVQVYGDEPWFPRVPESPEQVVEDFRRFVHALVDPDLDDAHWTLQHSLIEGLSFTHIGRTESLDDTVKALAEHVARQGGELSSSVGRENRTPLRMPRHAYDEEAARIVAERYAVDFDNYGYEPPAVSATVDKRWVTASAGIIPLLGDVIERNARIGQLSDLAKERGEARRQASMRAHRLEHRLERQKSRASIGGGPSSPVITNLENRAAYTVRWAWDDDAPLEPGFTAIVRVKNEARPLPFVLPPLLRALRHVVLVDNNSTDGTPDLAREIADREGRGDRLEVVSYPFDVARCGPEHLSTPAFSVHSLTYFYNWSFSQVRTSYALKWDGDMVLSETGITALRDLDWQLEAAQRVVTMPRYPLYIADDSTAFLDVGLANNEPWGWPNRPGYAHVKALDWELPLWPAGTEQVSLPAWSCVELKWLDADEFAHWSTIDFAASSRTKRKEREWQVHQSLGSGGEPPEGVVRVSAPAGEHVIDYVRRHWLTAERPRLATIAAQLHDERDQDRRAATRALRAENRRRIRAAYQQAKAAAGQ